MTGDIFEENTFKVVLGPFESRWAGVTLYFSPLDVPKRVPALVRRLCLFDTGAQRSYLTMDTFEYLCGQIEYPLNLDDSFTHSLQFADGIPKKIECIKRRMYIRLLNGDPFYIDFYVNEKIPKNIIGRKDIPEYMCWMFAKKEFYVLKKTEK